MTIRTVRPLAASLAVGVISALSSTSGPASASITFNQVWSVTLPDAGAPIALSSPNIANLASGPAVVVGDRSGHIYAYQLANGSPVSGWPFSTGGIPVDSTPSVWQPPGQVLDSVLVGVGNAAVSTSGGYQAISPQGASEWAVLIQNQPGNPTLLAGVQASIAIGQIQGNTSAVAPTLGQEQDALDASSGSVLNGFPWFQADSDFSSAALADLYNDGRTEIIEGGDSTAGNSYGVQYQNGGHLRILNPTGNAGTGNPSGGLACQYNTDQTVQSSPAVGRFLSGGGTGIAFGTGPTYGGASTTDDVLAVDSACRLQWATKLDGLTTSSPALANTQGNGQLDVVEGTNKGSGSGSVWDLNGANGQAIWHASTVGEVIGSVTTMDLGNGYQDPVVPTTLGVQIFDGKSGSLITTLASGYGFQNSPLITHDPNGDLGITVAGYNGSNAGVITHFEVANSAGARANEAGAWPMFHHDPQLTGSTDTASGDLTDFSADHQNNQIWNAYDRTVTANGPVVEGTPSATVLPGGAIHVYAQGANGDLIEHVNDNAGGRAWNAYDLSQFSGGGGWVLGSPSALYDSAQGLVHVYVQGANRDLIEYVNDNARGHLWNAYDLTVNAPGGGWVAGTPSALYDSAQGLVHVYVQGANGHLTEYVNDSAGGHLWNAYDLSYYSGGGGPVSGTPSALYDSAQGLVHTYIEGTNGHLTEYVNDNAGGHLWNAYDLSYYSGGGGPVSGTPSALYDSAQGLLHTYIEGTNGHLTEYVNDNAGGHLWNAYDLSYYSGGGVPMTGVPSALYDAGQGLVHIYVQAPNGHLTEFVNDNAGGHLWNAYDISFGSGGPGIGYGADAVIDSSGIIHVYADG